MLPLFSNKHDETNFPLQPINGYILMATRRIATISFSGHVVRKKIGGIVFPKLAMHRMDGWPFLFFATVGRTNTSIQDRAPRNPDTCQNKWLRLGKMQ